MCIVKDMKHKNTFCGFFKTPFEKAESAEKALNKSEVD